MEKSNVIIQSKVGKSEIVKCISDLETIADNIDMGLNVLYRHFFDGFYSECTTAGKFAGLPLDEYLYEYLLSYSDMVQLVVDRIDNENKQLRKIFETLRRTNITVESKEPKENHT